MISTRRDPTNIDPEINYVEMVSIFHQIRFDLPRHNAPSQQALRQAQLSAGEMHSKAQQVSRSVSAKSQRSEVQESGTRETKKQLQGAARKPLILYAPWPSWVISGCWIVGAPVSGPGAGTITSTDLAGREILSYVPLPLVADFLSATGQSIVSLYDSLPALTNNSNDPRSTPL